MLDEEHEGSFKQENAPRYHARDVALRRAPTRTDSAGARLGHAIARKLASRPAGRLSPGRAAAAGFRSAAAGRGHRSTCAIEFQDRRNRGGAISQPLHAAMDMALRDDGQVILLLNRRGFSTHIQCPACGAGRRAARIAISR